MLHFSYIFKAPFRLTVRSMMADQPYKILIVEDEGPLREVLEERFDNEGFKVFIAKDGAEGLMTALKEEPDIILLDIIMPQVDGLTMLKQLRANDKGARTRVIVLTNVNDSKEVHEALLAGATDFLVKSDWAISDLVDSVKHQLQEPGNYTA